NRTDESIGAVNINGLRGDALANGLMKAETKAKRRGTLSICGLGFLDETETETIPRAQVDSSPPAPQPALATNGDECTQDGTRGEDRATPAAGPQTIDVIQERELHLLCKDTNTDPQRFAEWYKAPDLAHLWSNHFESAKKKLLQKKEKQERKAKEKAEA